MANLFFDLPATPADGSGAPVDVSAAGLEKTITVQDAFRGTVNIEISNDGGVTWATIATFTNPGKLVIPVAAQFMRATRSGVPGIDPGLPNVDVGANDNGALFASLPATPGDGIGAPVDVSALGTFNTVTVLGSYSGRVNIEISDDGIDYSTCLSFNNVGGVQSKKFTARFMRVVRSGVVTGGTPVVSVGAINDASPGGGPAPAGTLNTILFQPGGPGTGPNVVTTWAEVMTLIADIRTANGGTIPIELQFDDSFGVVNVDPGVHDMTNVTWTYDTGSAIGTFHDVNVPEGAVFTNLRSFDGKEAGTAYWRVVCAATATTPITDLTDNESINIYGWSIIATGSVPFISASGLVAGDQWFLAVQQGGTGFSGAVPAIDNPVPGTTMFHRLLSNAVFNPNTISGAAGSTLILQASNQSFVFSQPALLASITHSNFLQNRVTVIPAPPAAPLTAASGFPYGETRYDASAGAIAQTLLPAATDLIPGTRYIFKEVSGANPVTLTPAGADTLDFGRVATIEVPPGGSVELIADGYTNWDIVGVNNPAFGPLNIAGPLTAPAGGAAAINDLVQVDVSAGIVPVTLPPITAASAGRKIVVKKIAGGGTDFTLTPAGADTIDGVAGASAYPGALVSVTLVSDGVSNWMVI